jgi:hypothetical protein
LPLPQTVDRNRKHVRHLAASGTGFVIRIEALHIENLFRKKRKTVYRERTVFPIQRLPNRKAPHEEEQRSRNSRREASDSALSHDA